MTEPQDAERKTARHRLKKVSLAANLYPSQAEWVRTEAEAREVSEAQILREAVDLAIKHKEARYQ